MGQIYVKVKDVSVDDNQKPTLTTGVETVITYKAYEYVSYKYELLYQCDVNGKQIPGNPNLKAQDLQSVVQKNAEAVVNSGPSENEKALQDEIARLRKQLEQTHVAQETAKPVIEVLEQADGSGSVNLQSTENPEGPKKRGRKSQTVEA